MGRKRGRDPQVITTNWIQLGEDLGWLVESLSTREVHMGHAQ